MTDKEVMQMALETLRHFKNNSLTTGSKMLAEQAIDALRAALAQPDSEPVAWLEQSNSGEWFLAYGFNSKANTKPLYTALPQRKWVGLTHEEKMEILTRSITAPSRIEVAEALLKEKNCG